MTHDPLIQAFFEEAAEALTGMEEALLRLEARPDDTDLLDHIFRFAHTLKGNSAIVGFDEIAHFTHALEDLLDKLRKRERTATPRVVNTILRAFDVIKTLLSRRLNEGRPVPGDSIAGAAEEERQVFDAIGACVSAAADDDSLTETSAPPEPSPRDAAAPTTRAAAVVGGESASIRVPIEKVDRLLNLVGELVITQSMLSEAVSGFSESKLPVLREAVEQLDRHARELHERMLAVRMVPVKALFGRFPRVVRDLGARLGKQVVLEISGESTELDKTVIEKISDPLVHLVRNSVDHGVETPEIRRASGKPEAGTIRLDASQRGGTVTIEVSDDGKGLDRDRILAKAIEGGRVSVAKRLSDQEIFGLIFLTGLSTAERVTELSGRGVGMDVVKRNIEALGGYISVRSQLGRGTTFRIQLPLTLAIIDAQAVRVGNQVYVIPLRTIVELVRPEPSSVHAVPGLGEVVVLRDVAIPLIRLHGLFGVDARREDNVEGLVVVVEHDGRRAALLVDELHGQQPVVVKSIESSLQVFVSAGNSNRNGIGGATLLGDGRVVLVLDVPGLIAMSSRAPARTAAVG